MSNRLPVEINPIRLIESRQSLQGVIEVDKLSRLSEMLVAIEERKETLPELQVELDFRLSEMKRPTLSGTITGILEFECQRCLKPVSQVIASNFSTILVESDNEAEQLQYEFDTWLLKDDRIFLADFIEDEVILSLPQIVLHDACETVVPDEEWSDDITVSNSHYNTNEFEVQQSEDKNNPFAVLKQLKTQN